MAMGKESCEFCKAFSLSAKAETCSDCGHLYIPEVEDCGCFHGHEEEEEEE